ncbi:MAG: Ig-like domain-containing protein, partial [Pirellulaceae bacterium]|nr:Ig-like domain-containing protein [Pirellulaceae bacterium]
MRWFLLTAGLTLFLSAPVLAVPAVYPRTVTLRGPESYQQLVATETDNERRQDVTRKVRYKSLDPQVAEVSPRGLVQPISNGQTVIEVTGSQGSATVPVIVKQFATPPPVSFRTQI